MDNPLLPARLVVPIVGAFFAACSFCLVPLDDMSGGDGLLFCACSGAAGAAPVLLAIGAVFGMGPYWVRIPICFGAGLLLLGWVFVGGVTASLFDYCYFTAADSRRLASGLLCLPLVFLAFQSPLWLVRLLFQWELVVASPSGRRDRAPLSSIRGMLTGTALVALALAGARIAEQLERFDDPKMDPEFWVFMGVSLAYCSGVSLLALPILIATLRSRTATRALLVVGVYTAMWVALVLIVWVMASPTEIWPLDPIPLSIVIVAFSVALTVPLLIARRLGYRLRWGREFTARLKPTD